MPCIFDFLFPGSLISTFLIKQVKGSDAPVKTASSEMTVVDGVLVSTKASASRRTLCEGCHTAGYQPIFAPLCPDFPLPDL